MADHPERQRLRPTVEGRARLLAAIEVAGQPHVVDAGTLGEYAELIAVQGQAEADAVLPDVAAHLASGCVSCDDDLRELVTLAAGPDPDVTPPSAEALPPRAEALRPYRRGAGGQDDSGIYGVDLPDVRVAELEAARRQRLRRVRDWLLIAAAVAILLIGLSLVGLAYLASSQPGTQIGLTPLPATRWAAPTGMTCPVSHPVKGNRPSMIYHVPGGEFYEATGPEDCYASPADAEAAGYRRSAR